MGGAVVVGRSRPARSSSRPITVVGLVIVTALAAAGALFGVPALGARLFADSALWNAGKEPVPAPPVLAPPVGQPPIPTTAGRRQRSVPW